MDSPSDERRPRGGGSALAVDLRRARAAVGALAALWCRRYHLARVAVGAAGVLQPSLVYLFRVFKAGPSHSAAGAQRRASSMMDIRVRTERLDIAPLALDEIDALIANDGGRLRELTGVLFPRPAAPPPYMADPLPEVRQRLRLHPTEAPWWNWLMFERETMRAVGLLAFAGPPDEGGAVLIGYAMYEQYEGHGYATEAVKAMIAWAFQQEGVRQVRTLAPVWNTPALRVAENVGMRPVAADEDDDVGEVLVYAVTAPTSVGSA